MPVDQDGLRGELIRLSEPELAIHGFELVDLEVLRGGGRMTLRVTIERPGATESGVGIEDCATASRALGRLLDAEGDELLRGRYVIEVSSPGIFRRLRKPSDFQRYVDSVVKVVAHETGAETTTQARGRLVRADDRHIEVEGEDGTNHSFGYAEIRKAHLDPDLKIGSNRPRDARS
jgi:ribosome maturation factor RimP